MKRKTPLHTDSIHHVFSKSINHYTIFNSDVEYERFIQLIRYYTFNGLSSSLSHFIRATKNDTLLFEEALRKADKNKKARVGTLAYCLMPTHFHLILHQTSDRGIAQFIADLCNGYTRYFNLRHNRKGPLWQNRFGNSKIGTLQELLETTRYVHLNPTTSYLTNDPGKWPYSSFLEYIGRCERTPICTQKKLFNMTDGTSYEEYVVNHIEEQRKINKNRVNLRG